MDGAVVDMPRNLVSKISEQGIQLKIFWEFLVLLRTACNFGETETRGALFEVIRYFRALNGVQTNDIQ